MEALPMTTATFRSFGATVGSVGTPFFILPNVPSADEDAEDVAEEAAAAEAAALEDAEDADAVEEDADALAAELLAADAAEVEAVALFAAHDARANTRHNVNKIATVFFICPPQKFGLTRIIIY